MKTSLLETLEKYLESAFQNEEIPLKLRNAVLHSLLAGGKRLRPLLFLAAARACCPNQEEQITNRVLPFAAALEMIHTYSLIHDDLPAMDNDDLRRGKPTCHKVFGDATAILAGDALLSDSFFFMSLSEIEPHLLLPAIKNVAYAIGSSGMVGGQSLDLESENKRISLDELNLLNRKKTGALITASCECGAILASADDIQRSALRSYGEELGLAFQITDDILDIVGSEAVVGKNVRHDAEKNKATWPALIGLVNARKEARRHCEAAQNALIGQFKGPDADFLLSTAEKLINRTH